MNEQINQIDKLPLVYKTCISNAVDDAVSIFGSDLLNVTLGGSAGKNNVIVGWSDVDLYIVLKTYSTNLVKQFAEKIKNYELHMGVTFYTLTEVLNNMVDNKTKIMIYEKYCLGFNPTLFGDNLFLSNSYEDVVRNDICNLPNILHEFRRMHTKVISDECAVDKKFVKKLLVLIKCYLNINGIFSYGYKSVIDCFLKIYNEQECSTKTYDFDIISAINDVQRTKSIVIDFSERVLAFIIKEMEKKRWKKELVHVE